MPKRLIFLAPLDTDALLWRIGRPLRRLIFFNFFRPFEKHSFKKRFARIVLPFERGMVVLKSVFMKNIADMCLPTGHCLRTLAGGGLLLAIET